MSIDLTLGFTEPPKDLQAVMNCIGFASGSAIEVDGETPTKFESYQFFDEALSARGVWFLYDEGIDEESAAYWRDIYDETQAIVATGRVTTFMDRNTFDLEKQIHTAKFLRDHYDAMLYDSQSGMFITD